MIGFGNSGVSSNRTLRLVHTGWHFGNNHGQCHTSHASVLLERIGQADSGIQTFHKKGMFDAVVSDVSFNPPKRPNFSLAPHTSTKPTLNLDPT
jgi:urease accessory protein UreE